MIPSVSAEKNGSLREQVVIAFNVAFEFLAILQPWMEFTPLYRWVKSAIWTAGVSYLEYKKLPLAQEMFSLGMYGQGKGLSEKARNF